MGFFARQFERRQPRLLPNFLRRELIDRNAGKNIGARGFLGMNSGKKAGGGARMVTRTVTQRHSIAINEAA